MWITPNTGITRNPTKRKALKPITTTQLKVQNATTMPTGSNGAGRFGHSQKNSPIATI